MTRVKQWPRLVTALGVGACLTLGAAAPVAAAGTGSAGHGTPVVQTAPAQPPVMAREDGACSLQTAGDSAAPTSTSGDKLLWLRAHPTGVVAIWIPGLNAKHCVARRTKNGASLAQRISTAIRHAKAFPTEPLPCPFDDRSSVRLYLTYGSGGDEYAEVSLDGCRPITAPGRAARWGDSASLERALRKAAPAGWRHYLGN